MDPKHDKSSNAEPANESAEGHSLTVERIKQALVTSRMTLAGHSTGADPYNSRLDRRRASIWGNRKR